MSGYVPFDYEIPHVKLRFELDCTKTLVTSELTFRRRDEKDVPLRLDGLGIELFEVHLDQKPLSSSQFLRDADGLTIEGCGERGVLRIETAIQPGDAGAEGLLKIDDTLVTHCEPQGFRRIAFFPDRPDILAKYSVEITADSERFATVLTNGCKVSERTDERGRRIAVWEDARPKASYLFALVAGRFSVLRHKTRTSGGREVLLSAFAKEEEIGRCAYGLHALARAIDWDAKAYGVGYDMAEFNIVALRDYPGGAMEYPGLNIYSSEFFLADASDNTDEHLRKIASSVGHEYFHEWSGNRVGIRCWNELSVKEGLTVFRQQQFMESEVGQDESRIDDILQLQANQFPEDNSEMAHAVWPTQTGSPANYYTRTIYDKGAEILRMIERRVGREPFRCAIKSYFLSWDGRSASIADLIQKIEASTGVDLEAYARWYHVIGHVRLVLSFKQSTDRTATITAKQELSDEERGGIAVVPIALALLDGEGRPVLFRLADGNGVFETSQTLALKERTGTFELDLLEECKVLPSFLRGYSAPVRPVIKLDDDDLATMAFIDGDAYAGWVAIRQLILRAAHSPKEQAHRAQDAIVSYFGRELTRALTTPAISGRRLKLPSEADLLAVAPELEIDRTCDFIADLKQKISLNFTQKWHDLYLVLKPSMRNQSDTLQRRLRNIALHYLSDIPALAAPLALAQLEEAVFMSDGFAALTSLISMGSEYRKVAIEYALDQWQSSEAKIDMWAAAHSSVCTKDAADMVQTLKRTKYYSPRNATRTKAIYDPFIRNIPAFHRRDGLGYEILAEIIETLAYTNPRLAGRFFKGFAGWRKFDVQRRSIVEPMLRRWAAKEFPESVREAVAKCLGGNASQPRIVS